jgi:hypothetical protein
MTGCVDGAAALGPGAIADVLAEGNCTATVDREGRVLASAGRCRQGGALDRMLLVYNQQRQEQTY